MKKQTLLKSTLCLLMALVCNVAWAAIDVSTDVDAPENTYSLLSKNGAYMSAGTGSTQFFIGRFAFFEADGENAYKIYSVDGKKWVSYTKAASYDGGANKATLVDAQAYAQAWYVVANGDYYNIAPLKNDGTLGGQYWNFHGGAGASDKTYIYDDNKTVGFYGQAGDGGSLWTLEKLTLATEEQVNAAKAFIGEGLGYPKTTLSVSRAMNALAFGTSTTKHVDVAKTAYLTTNDVQLPEDGKAYTIANYTKTGKTRYLYYTSGSALSVEEGDANASVFVCRELSAGVYAFVTEDGKVLTWMGGADGFQEGGSRKGYSSEYGMEQNWLYDWNKITVKSNRNTSDGTDLGHLRLVARRSSGFPSASWVVNVADGSWNNNSRDGYNFDGNHSSAWIFTEVTSHTNTDAQNLALAKIDAKVRIEGMKLGSYCLVDKNGNKLTNLKSAYAAVDAAESQTERDALLASRSVNLPTAGKAYYLKDNHGTYLDLHHLGSWSGAVGSENTLATMSATKQLLYITGNEVDGTWKIHTAAEGGNYLHQSSTIGWNSKVSSDGGNFKWEVEGVDVSGTPRYMLKNISGTQNGYLGANSHTAGNALYVNQTGVDQKLKMQLLPVKSITGLASTAGEWLSEECVNVATVDEIPAGIKELSNYNSFVNAEYTQKVITSGEHFYINAGRLTGLFSWHSGSGNKRVNIVAVEVVDLAGAVVAADYHWGYAGNPSSNNTYSVDVPEDGLYYLRYYAETASNDGVNDSDVDITYTLAEKNVDRVEEFVQGGVYTFVTNRGWVGANADSEVAIGTVKTTANPAASAENPNFLWTVYKSQKGNYYLYNIGKKKFLGAPSNGGFPFVEIPTSKDLSFKISGSAEYPIMFSTNNRHAVSQNANSGLFAWDAGWNKLDDGGSNHKVTLVNHLPEATLQVIEAIVDDFEFEGEPISGVEDFVNGGIYNFVTERGWMGATLNGTNVISTAKTSNGVTGRAKDPMFQWTVYKSTKGHYYLYNIGKKMFMGVESRNNTSVPFVEQPAGKKLTFKESASDEYPFMFSTDNAGVVNHSDTYGEGLVTWTGGWDKLDDGGSNHKISYVGALAENELATISELVERYDQQLYVTYEVEASWEDNPNTHFGSVRATSASGTLTTKLKKDEGVVMLDYNGLEETTIDFTRAYRGFEFQGFKLGDKDLGKSFEISEELKNSITEQNPLVAKFTATEAVTLFYDDDEFSYRIPAIATTSTGRLIAVSDYRHNLDDIGRDNHHTGTLRIDLVIRTSDDNGKTWSNIQPIAEGIYDSQADDCAYGDAAIAVVGNEVIVMAVAGAVQYNTGNAERRSRVVRIYSADNGVNWEKTDITEKVYGYEGSLYPNVYTSFFGSGRLAVDPNFNNSGTARIYGSMLTQGQGNIVIYSDDKGLTWNKLGGQVANANEPKVEILPSGQILFSARRNGGRNFNVFTYNDKSASIGSWSNAVDGCDNEGENGTNGETFLVDAQNARGEKVKLLLQSQPVGGGTWDRANVSIWYKEISSAVDHDHTPAEIASGWTKGLQVSHQLSAYSAMSLQKDGKIAFFFEEAPCFGDDHTKGYCMVYLPLTIEQITKNKYFSPAAVLPENITVNMVLTDAQGNEYHQTMENTTLANIGESVPSYVTLGENDSYVPNQDGSYTYTNTITLPFKVSNDNGTYWHNMYWPTAGGNAPVYMGANTSGETYVRTFAYSDQQYGNSPLNTQANEGKISWALYSVDNRLSFVFKNKETGKYIKVTGVHDGDAQNVEFAEKADATCFGIEPDQGSYHGDYALKTQNKEFDGYLCATRSAYGYATNFLRSTGVGTDHQGAWVIFKEAPDFDALKTEVNDVLSWIGEGLGKYAVSESNTAIVETAKTAMQTPNTVKLNDLNTYKNLLDGSTLNLPRSGQFMRLKGISGNYIDASSIYDNATGQMSMKSADECNYAGTIFYLDEEKHLLNYATATYIKETREIGSIGDAQKGVWTFAESPRTGKAKYALSCTTTNSNGRNLHDNSGNRADRCSSNCGDRHDFTLEPVTSLPFTFKKAALGFATFNAPVPVELPEGVLAYVAEVDENKTTLHMYRLEGNVIPANTPVMLYNEAAKATEAEESTPIGLKIVDVYTGGEADAIKTKNDFYGTVAAETYPASTTGETVYSLQKKQKVQDTDPDMVGFYKKADNTTLGGFKAWVKTATASARAFTIIFDGDDATGLKEALGLENENVEIYDLSGRRLDKPAKGVNVIGGKLVIK